MHLRKVRPGPTRAQKRSTMLIMNFDTVHDVEALLEANPTTQTAVTVEMH